MVIPPEAFVEYKFKQKQKVILISGSNKSGGFGLTYKKKLEGTALFQALKNNPQLINFTMDDKTPVKIGTKYYAWTVITDHYFTPGLDVLNCYGVKPGDQLLVVRGSGLALGFLARGPIVEFARDYPGLEIF
ncbi:MAG: hypothetical protein ACP5FK_11385 [bacterium]